MTYKRKYQINIHYLTSTVMRLSEKAKLYEYSLNKLVVEFGRLEFETFLQVHRSGLALLDQ